MHVAVDTDFLVRLSLAEHPGRKGAIRVRDELLEANHRFSLAPQVICEFLHVVTDPRRFERPLAMNQALRVAALWESGEETDALLPNESTQGLFLELLEKHRLGRKRLLDTMLAATCLSNGVSRIVTSNAADYEMFAGLGTIVLS